MIKALLVIGALLLLFITVILIRTLTFHPVKKTASKVVDGVRVDGDSVVSSLSQMIRIRTVSSRDKSEEDEGEFKKFEDTLPQLFPLIFEKCDVEKPSDRSILIRWRGKSDTAPTVLMAHYDVVSAEADKWEVDAFEGAVIDGYIWGRGVIDTKGSLNAILSAAQTLIAEGFTPESDVYFAFGGDEEINGYGASSIVSLFAERGIKPSIVLDEGGAVVDDVFPGVKEKCAVVGIAEKGMVNIEYCVTGGGGHASAPLADTPVTVLSRAALRASRAPFRFRVTLPTKMMFDTLGRHSTFAYRMIFANLGLFTPLLNMLTRRTGGQLNAIARTTVAFTKMQGSKGLNVIPPSATMASNSRILPGESIESTVNCIERAIGDGRVKIRVINGIEPSGVSTTDCEGWDRLGAAIGATWEGAIVSPYLMTACSDSRHWGKISDKVYRFSPFHLTKTENSYVHGNNERLPVDKVVCATEFYIRLMRMS